MHSLSLSLSLPSPLSASLTLSPDSGRMLHTNNKLDGMG